MLASYRRGQNHGACFTTHSAYGASEGQSESTSTQSNASIRSDKSKGSSSLDALFDTNVSRWPKIVGDDTSTPSSLTFKAGKKASSRGTPSRRQSMTQRELSVFEGMFDLLFDAASAPVRRLTPTVGASKSRTDMSDMDMFERLRKHSKHIKWTSQEEDALDRKKEAMDLCDTDQQLLEWAIREVFAESQQYEEEARRMLDDPLTPKKDIKLQPPAYPFLVAELMKKFRDKYSDPHLALSIFDYARNLSSLSYVFGCTTPAYNELIETRWSCFRDLRGVCDALEEMHVNGIELNTRTRGLAERIRQEIGERNLWEEEMSTDSGEVLQMMNFIEKLAAHGIKPQKDDKEAVKSARTKKWDKHQERWKSYALNEADDNYEFNRWEDVGAR